MAYISEVTHYQSISSVSDYVALTKPRVMSLVVFSSIAGMFVAPGHIHPLLAFVSILCIATASGASAAINMWYDRDIDAIMLRTRQRPIVRGAIEPSEALAFGVILGLFSVVLMTISISSLAGMLLLAAILFYVFIYTVWLKRSSVQNIVIGGAAGAFPPMIGWVCVTNHISIEPIILFAIIFLWTPPHFWALALIKSDDYRMCNIPMMPVVKGDLYTKKQILAYTILMAVVSIAPVFVGMSGYFYLATALFMNAIFIYYAATLLRSNENKLASKLFLFSIIYLFLIFGFMMIDHVLVS